MNAEDELLVTQSTLREWTRCRRKWWLSSYRRLGKPAEYKSVFVIGNTVHDALAAYYAWTYGGVGEPIDPIAFVKDYALRLMEENPEEAEWIARDAEVAGIMVAGYFEWLKETGADADFEKVSPERVIRAVLRPARPNPLGGSPAIVLLGKLDGKVLQRDGWTSFLEHKTVGNFVDLPAIAQIDRQFLTYHLLEYLELLTQLIADGETENAPKKPLTDGATLNMLKKNKHTVKAKPPFYQRHRVQHNIHQLRNHWRHVVAVAEEILAATQALDEGADHHRVAPPSPTTTCRWECPFFAVCALIDDGSDYESVLEFDYEERDPLARYAEEEPA